MRNPELSPTNYSLYLVTDSGMTGRDHLVEWVMKAVDGGVTMVQYREKTASTAQMIREATEIRKLLHTKGIPLIVNDRLDVALAAGADGVHLGQHDMNPATARKLMGPDALIGYSVETWQQAQEAERLDVDYFGVSPIFATPTKTDTGRPWGIKGLRELRASTRKPLVAIGGMNRETIAAALRAGADGVAVVSSICASEHPTKSARELMEIIRKERQAKRLST